MIGTTIDNNNIASKTLLTTEEMKILETVNLKKNGNKFYGESPLGRACLK